MRESFEHCPHPRCPTLAVTEVALLTGGFDRPYAFGLAMALASKGVTVDVIGSDEVDSPEMHTTPGLTFINLYGSKRRDASLLSKASRVLVAYARIMRYALSARPKIFHILWNNKIQFFDRTALMLYYRLRGKKIVITAHNVNAGRRDGTDSWLNRLTLKIQYRLADHIFVHTKRMKTELVHEFTVHDGAVTVIPFGINNSVANTSLAPAEARRRLGIGDREKTILFFGNIGPYKGLEFLVDAFQRIAAIDEEYRLVIAGKPRGGCEQYLAAIQRMIQQHSSRDRVIQRFDYIPDDDTEIYFKAADVLVLPYTEVSQSGVLFLAYSFGLPVVATTVGSLRDDIVEGGNGFLCKPRDPEDLRRAIQAYFDSDLFRNLEQRRPQIREQAAVRHSWDLVGDLICDVYERLVASGGGENRR